MFDDERAMVRLDMSEYQERHTVARLVGAPPGYVGYEEGGQLTEAVRRRPYSVVLLDEIEKAHAEVFDVLLQILDDGRLTDGQGRTVDFRNTVVIMTSNIRSAEALRELFRPEFLNRIDEVVVFEALTREQLGEIVELQLGAAARAARRARLGLELTDAAKEHLAEAGWDPTYGARPLKRALQRLVENPLALRLLEGDFAEGDTVGVTAGGKTNGGGGLLFPALLLLRAVTSIRPSARAARSRPTSAGTRRPGVSPCKRTERRSSPALARPRPLGRLRPRPLHGEGRPRRNIRRGREGDDRLRRTVRRRRRRRDSGGRKDRRRRLDFPRRFARSTSRWRGTTATARWTAPSATEARC